MLIELFLAAERMLWVDKYRPVQLDKLTYNDGLTQQLKRISAKEHVQNMCHVLFYGPPGAGKKTRIMALLREVLGDRRRPA